MKLGNKLTYFACYIFKPIIQILYALEFEIMCFINIILKLFYSLDFASQYKKLDKNIKIPQAKHSKL